MRVAADAAGHGGAEQVGGVAAVAPPTIPSWRLVLVLCLLVLLEIPMALEVAIGSMCVLYIYSYYCKWFLFNLGII